MKDIEKRIEVLEKSMQSEKDIDEVKSILEQIRKAAYENKIVDGKIQIEIK